MTFEFIRVEMQHRDLARAPKHALPAGFGIRSYRPGDDTTLLNVHIAAEPEDDWSISMFHESLGTDETRLAERVMFMTDPAGTDIGCITAWNSTEFDGTDRGQIHWVALRRDVQGRGLSKPLLSAACERLCALGYSSAFLITSTTFVPAVNLYRQFGFEPVIKNEEDRAKWQAATLTDT